MPPWSETAKSTRSVLPLPSRTACPCRSRRTRRKAHKAASSARAATAAAPVAIQAAVALDTLMQLGREDDRVVGGVVVRLGLARHGRDLDLDHPGAEAGGPREVAERDYLLLAWTDEVDRRGLHHRVAARL